jgi:hypothetical protein
MTDDFDDIVLSELKDDELIEQIVDGYNLVQLINDR